MVAMTQCDYDMCFSAEFEAIRKVTYQLDRFGLWRFMQSH
jgi:hypothetical protein